MAQTLEQFASDCHDILAADPGSDGVEKMRRRLEAVLADETFIATHLGPDTTSDRNILYEDPEFGFCIVAHVYEGPKASNPHDHGPTWAIYGQVEGVTEMTEWRMLEPPANGEPGKVEKVKTYELRPGMAEKYLTGQLHSPSRNATTRLIRIEGRNLKKVTRDAYVAVETV